VDASGAHLHVGLVAWDPPDLVNEEMMQLVPAPLLYFFHCYGTACLNYCWVRLSTSEHSHVGVAFCTFMGLVAG
jgi:hypothetical protein